ncbi:MAG: phosphoribosyltransferase family protein [Dehalococcoidia bacterium]|nr:phosphoribosyltransferase [Dehalococcoidia bacterium]MCA9825650.1 phosphoribosyltransferase [Dehalococcoidia bacterium]
MHSPIYVNVRRLISTPLVLDRCAGIMRDELGALMQMRNAPVKPFGVVCGVPFGGLHLSTVYSIRTSMPMIYVHPPGKERDAMIEGIYRPGQSCLIIDDLVTGGGSILETARHLRDFGLYVHDAIALVDRQEGGRRALKAAGVNLTSVLSLEQIANHLRSRGHIDASSHGKILDYIAAANNGG